MIILIIFGKMVGPFLRGSGILAGFGSFLGAFLAKNEPKVGGAAQERCFWGARWSFWLKNNT